MVNAGGRTTQRNELEAAFQDAIITLARLMGWLIYHTHDSRRSVAGWPDLALRKPPRLLLVEVKTTRGRVRPEQGAWLAALAGCLGVEVALWRLEDWPTIQRALVASDPLATE